MECCAIIFALEKFKPYLDHRRFTVVTDHCSLCFLKNKRKLPARLIRWTLFLEEFDFEIKYKSGKCHQDADCLSRYPVEGPDDCDQKLEERINVLSVTLDAPSFEKKQGQDSFCSTIIRQLQNSEDLSKNKQKRLKRFQIINGILYRKMWSPEGDEKRNLCSTSRFHFRHSSWNRKKLMQES